MRTNTTPFTSMCVLVEQQKQVTAKGYKDIKEYTREVFCNVRDGVSRAEFYEALKAGMALSATIEVWADEYHKEKYVEYDGTRYEIIRVYPSGYGTLELTCQEVVK